MLQFSDIQNSDSVNLKRYKKCNITFTHYRNNTLNPNKPVKVWEKLETGQNKEMFCFIFSIKEKPSTC